MVINKQTSNLKRFQNLTLITTHILNKKLFGLMIEYLSNVIQVLIAADIWENLFCETIIIWVILSYC